MNNNDFIKRELLMTEARKIRSDISKINEFIDNYGIYFKEKSSIEALKRIKDYIFLKQDKYNNLEKSIIDIHNKIKNSCTHDVLINDDNIFNCPICNKRFTYDNINFNCLMIEKDNYVSCETYDLVRNIIYDICCNNENILDTFDTRIDDDKIRIYRR